MNNGDVVSFKDNPLKSIYRIEGVLNGRGKLKIIGDEGYACNYENDDNTYSEENIKEFGVIIRLKPTTWNQLIEGDTDG